MLFRKVTRRWLVNGLGVVAVLLFIVVVAAGIVIRSYYYQQVENSLYTRARSFADMLMLYSDQTGFDFESNARGYMDDFPDRERMEFQVLSAAGDILASSTGFLPATDERQDYREALQTMGGVGTEHRGVWTGKNATGQKVMALTLLITADDQTLYGGIRYLVSLEKVDAQIAGLISVMVAFGLAVLFFVVLSSSYFISGILHPLTEIGETAKRIAMGDYSCRIEKQYDDEIGELCDTINDMAEKIGSAEKLQNEFISSVSHELRTPLTAIKGWSETLRDESLRDEVLLEKGLSVISTESERLSGMVEELLDFSRLSKSRPIVPNERVDVYAEAEEAVFLLNDRARREELHLYATCQERLQFVMGDRERLRQVFVNIIDNALKYSRPNGTVRVDAAMVPAGVQVVISDDGIGIPPEALPHIKEKFYRADNHRSGSGIGLAVADEIVRAHRGTLEIESILGEGTAVTVTLPTESHE